MRFEIQPSSPEPIYRQIVEQVRRHVASGQWRAGEELPSVRALALEHTINPMTVSKAYSLLETEGLLERRRGMGMVIAARQPPAPTHGRRALLEPALRSAALQARQLGLSDADALALFQRCLVQAPQTGETDDANS
jgi:GntR family transcriptional regulator